jgi:Domain of unknown function (DUF4160)
MPTILYLDGWRLFFYSNERNEPPHIHARKGDVECKYWLYPDKFDIDEAFAYNASPPDLRAVRKIIFEHFDYIIGEYEKLHGGSL